MVAQISASTGVAPCMAVVGVWGCTVHMHRPAQADLVAPAPCIHAPSQPAGLEGPSDGVYHPPKLNPVAMPEDRALSNKEMRRVREAQRRAQRRCVGPCRVLGVCNAAARSTVHILCVMHRAAVGCSWRGWRWRIHILCCIPTPCGMLSSTQPTPSLACCCVLQCRHA